MAFELCFSISRTAVEIMAFGVGVIVGAGIYIVKDLIEEEETIPEINYTEG